MISRGSVRFNCCESVLMKVNQARPLCGFSAPIMRIASNFGGGVGGWGSVCGAAGGANMVLGLVCGTEGNESPEEFINKREKQRALAQEFMKSFEARFGSVNCVNLVGVDFRTEEGKKRYREMSERGETRCGEYIDWSAARILDIIASCSK